MFTVKRPGRGNSYAQELATAVHFEQFARATEKLLLKRGLEPRRSMSSGPVGSKTDGLGAQRENSGAAWAIGGPFERSASGHAISNLASQ
jgi:hypothetical protein